MRDLPVWAMVILAVQAFQLALLGGLYAAMRRARRDRGDSLESLARGLQAPFGRLAQEWSAEHERLHSLTTQAGELVKSLSRLQFQASIAGSEESAPATVADQARDDARTRLTAGESVEQVVAATGLTDGEVRVLAGVVKARGGSAA
jgi:hypothetical protein